MPHQQMLLDAAAQPIGEQEALNGRLENIEAKDDNKDQDSDNNDKGDESNIVNWLDRRTEGEKTTRKWKQGLFGSYPQEVQDAIIQCAIEGAPEQRKRNNEGLEAQRKAKEEKKQLIRELKLYNATKAYIDAMGEPGDVLGENALVSSTYQNSWNFTVLTSSDNPPLLHDINSPPPGLEDTFY